MIESFEPDKYYLEKRSFILKSQEIGKKEYYLTREKGKTIKKPLRENKVLVSCLSEAQLIEISKVIRDMEKLFSRPIQIEWGIASGKLFILNIKDLKICGPCGDVKVEEIADEKMISSLYDQEKYFGPEVTETQNELKPVEMAVAMDLFSDNGPTTPVNSEHEIKPEVQISGDFKSGLFAIIDKYAAINPDLNKVFEYLREDINNYFKGRNR